MGKAHAAKAGRRGFCGLLPNDAGVVPIITAPELAMDAAAMGYATAGGAGGVAGHGAMSYPAGMSTDIRQHGGGVGGGGGGGGRGAGGINGSGMSMAAMHARAAEALAPLRRVDVSLDAEHAARAALAHAATVHSKQSKQGKGKSGQTGIRDGGPPAAAQRERERRERPRAHVAPPSAPRVVPGGGPHARQRNSLPVAAHKGAILATLDHDISILRGETGCGKTTQVAQFLLERAAETGAPINIICTQPRRVAAIGVGDRVAAERGERVGQGAVGYSIRGEQRTCGHTRLLFCTTGILLRRLEADPELAGVTHVLVDETHERSLETDFLLMALRELLRRQQATPPAQPERRLRVCCMSATLDAAALEAYFAEFDCPRIDVPGRTFPVQTMFLEDALAVTQHRVDSREDWCRSSQASAKKRQRAGKVGDAERGMEGDMDERELLQAGYSPGVARALADLDHDAIDFALIAELVDWLGRYSDPLEAGRAAHDAVRKAGGGAKRGFSSISHEGIDLPHPWVEVERDGERYYWNRISNETSYELPEVAREAAKTAQESAENAEAGGGDSSAGAILVFLPGSKEIQTAYEMLFARVRGLSAMPQRDWVIQLHGGLPPDEQRRAFQRPPAGCRKIVLATNVAETSITIDDVAFVIDTCRLKEQRYDPETRIASLDDVPCARAAAKQRRGRAGRVRPGLAFHLMTRPRHDDELKEHQAPEVKRVPLEQLVLRAKALRLTGAAAAVCARLPEPPEPKAVTTAISELVGLGALELVEADEEDADEDGEVAGDGEELTPLGWHLTNLPVDARLGKLIIYGAIFNATDEACTIAAALASRSPFLSPLERRDAADASKKEFGWRTHSDHLAIMDAYRQFDSIRGDGRYAFARERFLGVKTLQSMGQHKRQFLEALSDAGFVPRGLRSGMVEGIGRRFDGSDGVRVVLAQRDAEMRARRAALQKPKDGPGHEQGNGEAAAGGGAPPPAGGTRYVPPGQRGPSNGDGFALPSGPLAPIEAPPVEQDQSPCMLAALLCAALYPRVAAIHTPKKKKVGKPLTAEQLRFFIKDIGAAVSADPTQVWLHPSSVNSSFGELPNVSPYVCYHELVRTTKEYLRESTPVPPLALVLFGGSVDRDDLPPPRDRRGIPESVLTVDRRYRLAVPSLAADDLLDIRERLDAILAEKIERPQGDISEEGADLFKAVGAFMDCPCSSYEVNAEERQRINQQLGGGGGGGKKKKKKNKGRGRGGGNRGGGGRWQGGGMGHMPFPGMRGFGSGTGLSSWE